MNHTILIVDDEQSVLNSVFRALHGEDYKVITSNSSKDALQVLKQSNVSVIVSDMRMPGMDGIEFLGGAQKLSPDSVKMILSEYSDIEKIMELINERHNDTSKIQKTFKLDFRRI